MTEPMRVETDVLVIGSGAAGMYAAIEAARAGASVFLLDRSLIGRGGATVMAQMTVAVALGDETPDHWTHHYQDTLTAGRGLCNEALARLLCEEGPACIREMDAWGVGWARKDGQITRPSRRATTGRAASMWISSTPGRRCRSTLRGVVNKTKAIARAGDLCVVDLIKADGEVDRRGRLARRLRRAGDDLRQGDDRRDRRADAALPAQQRLRQHGRRRLCAGAARGRAADRHGVRAVLPDRPSGAAPDRHGPDHVGSVPLQARRQAPEQQRARSSPQNYGVAEDGKYVITRDVGTYAILKEVEAGRGSPHGGVYLSFQHVPGAEAARGIRPGDRPAGGERHRSHQAAGRGRADRALPHGRRAADAHMETEVPGPARRRRSGRRRQRRQPAFRQRHHRGAGVRPPRRAQRGATGEGRSRAAGAARRARDTLDLLASDGPDATRRTPPR